MTEDRQTQRNQLIRHALVAALQRVDQSAEPDDVFAPIGELVFWIIAADEGLRKQYGQPYISWRKNHQHGHLLPGIRYARNKVAHESEAWDYGEEPVDPDVYFDNYRYTKWTWVQLPAPGPKDPQHWKDSFDAYKHHLCDEPVIDTTRNAVDLLEDWWKQHGI